MRTCVWPSSAGGFVMAEVEFEDSGTDGYVMMSAGILSGNNRGLLSWISDSSSLSSGGSVTMVGGESIVSNRGDKTVSIGSSAGGSWLVLRIQYRSFCVIDWW